MISFIKKFQQSCFDSLNSLKSSFCFVVLILASALLFSCAEQNTKTSTIPNNKNDLNGIGGGQLVLDSDFYSDITVFIYFGQNSEVESNKSSFCTGVLLEEDIVLTANHCLANVMNYQSGEINNVDSIKYTFFVSNHTQVAKILDSKNFFEDEKITHVEKFKNLSIDVASKYLKFFKSELKPALLENDLIKQDHDLVLLKLQKPLAMNGKKIKFLTEKVYSEMKVESLDFIFALGYGFENEKSGFGFELNEKNEKVSLGANGAVLKSAKVPNFSNSIRPVFNYPGRFKVNNAGETNICFGDSGGPGFVAEGAEFYLYGIASAVNGRGDDEDECKGIGHYTKVTPYIEWIKKTIVELRYSL